MVYKTIDERLEQYKRDLERAPTRKESRYIRETKRFFVNQAGRCAVCKVKFEAQEKSVLNFQGPMKDEIYRGLLCEKCDIIIRMCGESRKILMSAIEFLNKGSNGILNQVFDTDRYKTEPVKPVQKSDEYFDVSKPKNWSEVK